MNITEYKIPKILFLRGVFIKDCIPLDDIFELQIIEQLNMDDPIIIYNEFPSVFTNLKSWVKKTNLKCWYCDLNFMNSPVFIPKIIEHSGRTTDYNISTHGCFCSFCCAVAHTNLHHPKICTNIKIKEMLRFLYRIFNGRAIKEILPSPTKYIMNHYGGSCNSHAYRNMINKTEVQLKDLEYD
jgi:hypothetical protein